MTETALRITADGIRTASVQSLVLRNGLRAPADAVGVHWRAAFSATGIICGFFLMTLVAVVNAYTSGRFDRSDSLSRADIIREPACSMPTIALSSGGAADWMY